MEAANIRIRLLDMQSDSIFKKIRSMKVAITKYSYAIEKEVREIETPAYYEYGSGYYKIISGQQHVYINWVLPEITSNLKDYQLDSIVQRGTKITKEEWETIFDRVYKKIKTLK